MGAASALAARGIECEVIDLRSLWPWDKQRVFASVARTGRALIVQQSQLRSQTGSMI